MSSKKEIDLASVTINPELDIIKQHDWGVSIENHHGLGIFVGDDERTDVDLPFALVAIAVGKVIGITHLIDFTQTNEV